MAINRAGLTRVCLTPRMAGVGGMVSFQHKLADGLARRGIAVCYDLDDEPYQAVLVIGGTRHLAGLWRARRRGLPVVQRLDGINWLHRLAGPRRAGLRHYLRAEYGNRLLAFIRRRLASRIVYQSHFVRGWWERTRGATPVACTIIYNGVDLDVYTPHAPEHPPDDRWRLLLVEGSLAGGYEQGLETAIAWAEDLAANHAVALGRPLELMVVGRLSPELQEYWQAYRQRPAAPAGLSITWAGLAQRQQIPAIDRAAHVLFSADLNAACPNAVIEALACGLPVVAFDTGALPELVANGAGGIARYGGDPWRLDPPDVPALARATLDVLANQPAYSQAARRRAETAYGLETMVDAYLQALEG